MQWLLFILYISLIVPLEEFEDLVDDAMEETRMRQNEIQRIKEIKVYEYNDPYESDCVLEVGQDFELCHRE